MTKIVPLFLILSFVLNPLGGAQDFDFFSLTVLHQKILSDESDKRDQALRSLPNLDRQQKKEMVDILETSLENPNRDIRLRTLIALEKMGGRKAKRLIREYRAAYTKEGLRIKHYKFPGADMVIKRQQENSNCYEYEKFFVLTLAAEDRGDVVVLKRKRGDDKMTCDGAAEDPDFFLDQAWVERFFGVSYPYVFVHNSTTTGPDWLTIYDIRILKKRFSTEYHEPVRLREGHFEYWVDDGEATPTNCDKYGEYKQFDIDMVIRRQVKLDLYNLNVIKLDKTRCVPKEI